MKNFTIKAKLLTIGFLISLLLLVTIMATELIMSRKIIQTGDEQSLKLANADLEHIVDNVYTLADSHQEVTQKNIVSALNVAEAIVGEAGGFSFSDEKTNWKAVDQYTKSATDTQLPRMLVGSQFPGRRRSLWWIRCRIS